MVVLFVAYPLICTNMIDFNISMLVDVLTNMFLLTIKLMVKIMNKMNIETVWNLGGLKRTHCS